MYRYSFNPAHLDSLADKLAACRELGIPCLELDGRIDGTAFADMTPDAVEDARRALILAGVSISLTTISCCLCDADALRRFLQTAHFLGVENLCISACDAAKAADLKRWAASYGMGLIVANTAEAFDDPSMTEAARALDAGVLLDPYLHVSHGSSVFWKGYYPSRLKNAVRFVRISDGLPCGEGKRPGAGSADLRELVSLMLARSYDGFFSLSVYPGFNDTAALASCLAAFRKELSKM